MNAQKEPSPYDPQFKTDMSIAVVSGVGLGITQYLIRKVKPLEVAELGTFNSGKIWEPDRIATDQWNPNLEKWSRVTSGLTMGLPLALLGDKQIRKDYKNVVLMGAETFLITDLLGLISKVSVRRVRPFVYNDSGQVPQNILLDENARMSFFSRKMASASAMCFFTAKLFADYNPTSKFKPLVWTTAAVLPLATGIVRYKSGYNYPTDLLTGYLVGAGIGVLVPYLHRKIKNKKRK